jgi:hypothetical protein
MADELPQFEEDFDYDEQSPWQRIQDVLTNEETLAVNPVDVLCWNSYIRLCIGCVENEERDVVDVGYGKCEVYG